MTKNKTKKFVFSINLAGGVGNMIFLLLGGVALLLILWVLWLWLSALLPVILGILIVAAIIYIIYLLAKPSKTMQQQNDDIVSQCKSQYTNPDDVYECIADARGRK